MAGYQRTVRRNSAITELAERLDDGLTTNQRHLGEVGDSRVEIAVVRDHPVGQAEELESQQAADDFYEQEKQSAPTYQRDEQ